MNDARHDLLRQSVIDAPVVMKGEYAYFIHPSLASGNPLVVGRKRAYGLPGEFAIDQTTGYSKGEIYLNDVKEGDRVLLVDDVVSTGGTLLPILKAIDEIQAIVSDCWIIFEKGEGMDMIRSSGDWPLNSLVKIEMIDHKVSLIE